MLAFSKDFTRNLGEIPAEPIISLTINTVQPCYGTDKERLILGD